MLFEDDPEEKINPLISLVECIANAETAIQSGNPKDITLWASEIAANIDFLKNEYDSSLDRCLLNIVSALDMTSAEAMEAGTGITRRISRRAVGNNELHKQVFSLWSRCFNALVDIGEPNALSEALNIMPQVETVSFVEHFRKALTARLIDISDQTVAEIFGVYDAETQVCDFAFSANGVLSDFGMALVSSSQGIGLEFHRALVHAGRTPTHG